MDPWAVTRRPLGGHRRVGATHGPLRLPAQDEEEGAGLSLTRLRIATFNIRHGRGMDGSVDLERTARTMTETGADVIALQEVDRLTARTGGLDEPAILQELTGLSVAFWPTLRLEGGHFGIALAARGTLETRFEALDNAGVGRPHGVVVTTVRGVVVLGTHLSTEPAARASEGRDLLALVRDMHGPLVVAGDLNQSRRHLGAFRAVGLDGDRRTHPTHPSLFPLRQIDHVLARGGARVERSWTVKSLASDHLALVAEVNAEPRSLRDPGGSPTSPQ